MLGRVAHGKTIDPSTLAEDYPASRERFTQLRDSLLEEGLLADGADGRVALTAAGRDTIERLFRARFDVLRETVHATPADVDPELAAALDNVSAELDRIEAREVGERPSKEGSC